ncbi:tyrosine-type recombinase/integrase [Nocardia cyriacigeorgica]|jgi:integrase|uniref:tyrosine-type recombinase/integrase n=1 Tax=Nocardia cyriacigeorgica TaxID=135487 RepID=UPI000315A900|nr:site-specific integrase [Nocardia cyriacigeorgica]AVH24585.1 site-specific integrase [Nocardia cyriacigeorgica]MBF6323409.1 site-specific integrase [Nocardia cyriacigeorgica]MBF6498755.1 site-specific integrase [Nocardia cyriacigeorgica]PPJ01926.1 site-specific integrase [Nocardia cyriacigeorgica]TLF57753.1 site-specific integrase [Nocardia cyriacigeorgica]
MTDNSKPKRTRRAEPINKHTAKNGKVSYWFQIDVGTRPDGKRDRQQFTYSTVTEARREYRRICAEVAAGTFVGRTRVTVGQYLTSWLDGRRDIRPDTLAGYRAALKPVADRLGSLPLQQLTKEHIDAVVSWRLTEGRGGKPPANDLRASVLAFVAEHPEGVRYAAITERFGDKAGKYLDRLRAAGQIVRPARGLYALAPDTPAPRAAQGVKARTVVTMLTQLTAALDDAMEQGLIPRNVARMVKRPDVEDTEMQVWTREQAATFREHVRDQRLYPLFLLSLCGLRRSEIMGLRWSRIDGATVHVRRGRVAVGSEVVEGDPKSRRSRRSLPLPPDVAAALRSFKVTQKAEALALGIAWDDERLVAVDEEGEPIRPEWYSDEFQRQAKAAGVPVIRLHDARHTAATILLDSGASVAAAAKWLGHDPAVLLRVYGHVYDETLEATGAALFGGTQATGT